jgi:mono/diheme cytochrome c family protein
MSTLPASRRIALAVTSVLGIAVLSAAVANGPSTKDGAFTAEQAERGKAVYDKSCVNCHQADFYRERLSRWQGKSVEQLFESVSTTMPADNVGALLTSEYVDVLAYIFSVTGSPAGTEELTSDNMGAVTVGPVE